ncbi:MAG: putative lipid II flippase FtsW [Nitrospiraceae bacterium]
MSRRGSDAGTLGLPWPASAGPARQRMGPDASVLLVAMVLALLGLVMVFSASAVVAGNRFHDPLYFLKRQLAWLAFGFLLLHVASRLDYTVWRRMALPMAACSAVLLILVLVPSIGVAVKGARRWLRVGPLSVQPAEFVKLVVVVYLAAYLAKKEERVTECLAGLLPPLIVSGLLGGLVLWQPDLGTAVVIGLVTMGLLFLGGARLWHLTGLVLSGLALMFALVRTSPYRWQRLMTFVDPWKDPTDAGFQMTQSFLAFGSGGVFGIGLGESKQKLFFLPEGHTDFMLALVGEELGLLGTAFVMVLFMILVLKGFQIAGRAREPFGRYLALGITLLLGLQVLINAGVVTGLLPTKGLTLPLMSYGGSSLLVSLVGIGILLSISRDRQGGRRAGVFGSWVAAR